MIASKHPNSKKKRYIDLNRWKNDIKAGIKGEDIAYTIIFDKLLKSPNQELKKLCNFLGLKFEKRLLNYKKFTTIKKNIAWGDKKVKSLNLLSIKELSLIYFLK